MTRTTRMGLIGTALLALLALLATLTLVGRAQAATSPSVSLEPAQASVDLTATGTLDAGGTIPLRYLAGDPPPSAGLDGDPGAIWPGDSASHAARASSVGYLQALASGAATGGTGTSFTSPSPRPPPVRRSSSSTAATSAPRAS